MPLPVEMIVWALFWRVGGFCVGEVSEFFLTGLFFCVFWDWLWWWVLLLSCTFGVLVVGILREALFAVICVVVCVGWGSWLVISVLRFVCLGRACV